MTHSLQILFCHFANKRNTSAMLVTDDVTEVTRPVAWQPVTHLLLGNLVTGDLHIYSSVPTIIIAFCQDYAMHNIYQ